MTAAGLPGRFYPVVADAAAVQSMVEAGARLVQLRVKAADPGVLQRHVRLAKNACAAADCTLVLNDHWQMALEHDVDFVHLGQEDLLEADLPAIRRAGIRFGVSTHSDAELDHALEVQPDYIALGPIWPTTLKKMPWAPQGLHRIGEWKRRIGDLPLVAIGGITLDRAPSCLDSGADAVAVVSDVLSHTDPTGRARDWIAATGS